MTYKNHKRIALLGGMMIDDLGFRVWHQMMLHIQVCCAVIGGLLRLLFII